jgi:intracellular multiplication protein IcmB
MKREALESAILHLVGIFSRNDIDAVVSVVAPFDSSTLITKTGDLVTFLRVEGRGRFIGNEEFDDLANKLSDQLAKVLSDGNGRQHRVSIGYRSDPDGSVALLRNAYAPALATAHRIGAGQHAREWFDAKIESLAALTVDEYTLVALFTQRSGLSKEEKERAVQELSQARKGAGEEYAKASSSQFSQPALGVPPLLVTRHRAAVKMLLSNLTDTIAGTGLIAETLRNEEALPLLAEFLNGQATAPNWKPTLLGKTGSAATVGRRNGDAADVLPAALSRQLFTERSSEGFGDYEYVKRGKTTHVGLKMDVCPVDEPAPQFNWMARRISEGDGVGARLPYTATFDLYPDGMSYRKSSANMASFLGGLGAYNASVKAAWDALRAKKTATTALRGVFTTWSSSSPLEAFDRVAQLKTIVQNWGGTTVSNESGAPAELCAAAAPGLLSRSPMPFVPAPIATAARMMPLFRPASPWRTGDLLLRTEHGKPFPVAFGSSVQANSGGVVLAPPGRGKSFLMNSINFGAAYSAGLNDLPYVTIIDFGMSSQANIALLQSHLPAHKRHQAVSLRVRNDPKYSSNPFDTQLGFDRPTQRERDFQRFIVETMAPNLGAECGKFIGAVIDAAYDKFSRTSPDAKKWQRSKHSGMTAVMEELGIVCEGRRVYDLVDELFDRGRVHEAVVVQRYAVPTLFDLIPAARSQSVKDQYNRPEKPTPTPSGEAIVDVFTRNIGAATSDYALLSTVTQYDIGDARVLAIDLEEMVSGSPDVESKRRAAIMMMFARHLGAKNYFLRWEELEATCPARYATYHEKRVRDLYTSPKFLEYDEFHYASGVEPLLELVEADFRTGRKYQVFPFVISQQFGDFSPKMLKAAASLFILGAGSEQEGEDIQKAFKLTNSERQCIMTKCLGPNEKGTPLFAIFKTVKGLVTQMLYHTASPLEMWAFNSSAIDAAVRSEVAAQLGDYWQALRALAKQHPSGSVRKVLEGRKLRMDETDQVEEGGLTITIGREIAARANEIETAQHT